MQDGSTKWTTLDWDGYMAPYEERPIEAARTDLLGGGLKAEALRSITWEKRR